MTNREDRPHPSGHPRPRLVIPAKATPTDTPTVEASVVLVTSAGQPDDIVYAVTRAVLENFDDFRLLLPRCGCFERNEMVPSVAVMPIHPGALRYYREAGLLPQE